MSTGAQAGKSFSAHREPRMSGKTSGYIHEIDSLRAVAVSLVMIFHVFPGVLPGGFIGVDVFFVISGFVISRVYLHSLVEQRLRLRDFYAARFRRLAPAMILVAAVTAIACCVLLEPDRLVDFAWSLAAQPFFAQNFVFWIEGDYFNGAFTKPLLHTWSLAVEEQFYMFWALLVLFFRRNPRAILACVLVMGVLSIGMGRSLSRALPRRCSTCFRHESGSLPSESWRLSPRSAPFDCNRESRISSHFCACW